MRMPNSAIDGMVWIRLSVPRIPARRRGTRWQRMPSGSATSTAAPSEPSASNTCRARLAREALGVRPRIRASPRGDRTCPVREAPQAHDAEKQRQKQHPQHRAGPQARDGIGGDAVRGTAAGPRSRPRGRRAPRCCPAGVSASPAAAMVSATRDEPERARRTSRTRARTRAQQPPPARIAAVATRSRGCPCRQHLQQRARHRPARCGSP